MVKHKHSHETKEVSTKKKKQTSSDGGFTSPRSEHIDLGKSHYILVNWYEGDRYVHIRNKFNSTKKISLKFSPVVETLIEKKPEIIRKLKELRKEDKVKGDDDDDEEEDDDDAETGESEEEGSNAEEEEEEEPVKKKKKTNAK